MKIVCISGKAQHGKDTTAKLLEETLEAQGNRVLIAHYGDLVKYVCKNFFGWDGKKDEKGRTLLQRVGTDKIRAVSPDYWVDFIVSILDIFCDEWDYVLIPDTRFPNEYEIYETYGMDAILLRVVRPNFVSPLTEEQQKHASETALDDYQYDAIVTKFEYKPLRSFTADDIKLLRLDYASQDDPQLLMEEYLPIKNFELLYGWWKQHYKATLKDCDNPQAIILHLASTD